MNEESARAVTLLQAFESVQPPCPSWGDDDRAWATRAALEEAPGDAAPAFLARRARHAAARLGAREPRAAALLARRLWQRRWLGAAILGAFVAGLLADSIGSSQRINLLAPPLWALLAWNAAVYLILLGHALAWVVRRPPRPGALVRLLRRLLRAAAERAAARAPDGGGSAAALQTFAVLWAGRSAPLATARATLVLHAAAAALASGLIAGLYLRGLVLDYRAGWESTFLSAGAAHAVLTTVLAPAAALTGIVLPDPAGFEAMRLTHDGAPASATAAPWIHLFALTLAWFVVLPRIALALLAAVRAHWLAGHLALPLADAYFQQLVRQQQGDVARVRVQPYATAPGMPAAALQRMFAPVLGDGLQVAIAPPAQFGAEDEEGEALPLSTTLAVAFFDLSATPELETHGRYAQQLAARAPPGVATILVVDETRLRQRFGADSIRLGQRRDAWRRFAEALGSLPVFFDAEAADGSDASRGVQLAMRSPLRPAAQ